MTHSRITAAAARLGARLRTEEEGFTLIELMNVLLIMAILMSISYSSYSTLHARAEQRAAQSSLSGILPAISAWRVDHGTYAGMSVALLNSTYGTNFDVTLYAVGTAGTPDVYCAQYTVPTGTYTARTDGPGAPLTVALTDPANNCP